MKIQIRTIDSIVPYAKNPRKHSKASVDKIARSIQEFGWKQPIVVDTEGVIVMGHGRLAAAKQLGMTEVPVHIADDLNPAQIKALRIADNRVQEESEWDYTALKLEVLDLKLEEVDLSVLGFDSNEFDAFMVGEGELAGGDELPAEGEIEARSKLGDLWQLGDHRLMCGDSTDAAAVARLLEGISPHLMVTDPPYGVNYDPSWRSKYIKNHPLKGSVGKVENDHQADWAVSYSLSGCSVIYIWHSQKMVLKF